MNKTKLGAGLFVLVAAIALVLIFGQQSDNPQSSNANADTNSAVSENNNATGDEALAQADEDSEDNTDSTDSAVEDEDIRVTDGVKHSVPLDQIIFDDFDIPSRSRPLTNATQEDIERLRDRITPICASDDAEGVSQCLPLAYESAADADTWMNAAMQVIGYIGADGQAYAYPFSILNFHEIVNDTIGGHPVLISYCPLCNSAVVYSRIYEGDEIAFGNTSALYNSDMVMYDGATDSFWFQVEGVAIVGELTGARLDPLPSIVTNWEQWKSDHPDTLVLARPNDRIDYARDVFGRYPEAVNNGRFAFPVNETAANDRRLQPADNVILIELGDEKIAYPLAKLGDAATVDTVNGQQIVIFSRDEGQSGAAFEPVTEAGTAVELEFNDGVWVDKNTGSHFDLSGRAVAGELEGQQLVRMPSRFTFWFAAVATAPDVEVYAGDA